MIFVSIYEITDTYGLFESNKTLTVDNTVAKWNIYINETNINETTTFTVDNFTLEETSTVADGKIAPGTTGYFDITIDPTDTQVSIRYDLTFDFSAIPSNITISGIEETSGSSMIRTGEFTYSNYLVLSDIEDGITNNIRVYLAWNNEETNNEIDTEIGMTEDNYIEIPVSITVSQYLNETLEPYVEEENNEE